MFLSQSKLSVSIDIKLQNMNRKASMISRHNLFLASEAEKQYAL